MSLFNVGNFEGEKLAKNIEMAEIILSELDSIQNWIAKNQNLDVKSASIEQLEGQSKLLNENDLGSTFAFGTEHKKSRYYPKEALSFEHSSVRILKEKWQQIQVKSLEISKSKSDFDRISREIRSKLAHFSKISRARKSLQSVKSDKIPKGDVLRYKRDSSMETKERYFVPKSELIQSPPKEARNSKQDLYRFYQENAYPSLIFSAADANKPEFEEIKNVLKPFLLAEAEYAYKESWRFGGQIRIALIVQKGLENDLRDAVKLHGSKFSAMSVQSAFINEHGYYPAVLLQKKMRSNLSKKTSTAEKVQRKRERFARLISNMEQGKFHSDENSDASFLSEDGKYLEEMGFNKYAVAKIYRFPIDMIDAEKSENKEQLEQALAKHEVELCLEVVLALLESDAERMPWYLLSKLRKHDIYI